MAESDVTVWFNPNCSKCRGARDLLDAEGVTCELVRYLEEAPSRAELQRVMGLLGIDDPRAMMRTGEAVYKDEGLGDASPDELLDAMVKHPILIERPIVETPNGVRLCRPQERVREIL